MIESIAGMATSMKNAELMQSVGVSLMKMTMDLAQEQAAAVTQMMAESVKSMEMSVAPYLGGNLDVLA